MAGIKVRTIATKLIAAFFAAAMLVLAFESASAYADEPTQLNERSGVPLTYLTIASPDENAPSAGGETPTSTMKMSAASTLQANVADWERLAGEKALDTMSAIVDEGWQGSTGGTVVIATDAGYWDALTAASVAGIYRAPVLMTAPKSLSSQTADQLKALKPTKVIICGGPSVVSDQVAKKIEQLTGVEVQRYYGKTMTDTADKVFSEAADDAGTTWSRRAFIATSDGYWDALAAAPISYRMHMPILLTKTRDSLSKETLAVLEGNVHQVVIVGGTDVVSEKVEKQLEDVGIEVDRRLGGKTAIDTSALVAEYGIELGMSEDGMGVATQWGYWDALAGAALCGKLNSVLVLVDDEESPSISGFVGKYCEEVAGGYVFGGPLAIGDATVEALKAASIPQVKLIGEDFFSYPLAKGKGFLSSGFGYRTYDNSFHRGADFAADEGTPYYAAADGVVRYATNDDEWNGGAGNWVVLDHGNGIVTKYMHSKKTFVEEGDEVKRGEHIGDVGNTGDSDGAHLHFQIEVDGVALNPLHYI